MKAKWMMIAGLVGLFGMAQASFVTIGHAGNAADTTGYGAVGYNYQISATEVTIAEFQASGAGDGNENWWNDDALGTSVGPAAPATKVSLYEAMKYCNWLTSGNVYNGAYQFSGGVYESTDRASAITAYGTIYAVPTEDEWYKAAYFKPDASGYSLYANGTGTIPTRGTAAGWNYYDWDQGYVNSDPNYAWVVGYGGVEQNGTYNMMGNVWEWMEDAGGAWRGSSCGYGEDYMRSSAAPFGIGAPDEEDASVGFRVVAVNVIPEPATALSLLLGGLIITGYRRMRKAYGHF